MKCSIITIHHIHNFGSIFQAYSLQRFLEQAGYEVELIDYRPAYYDKGRSPLKTFVGRLMNLSPYLTRKKKFEKFLLRRDNLSDKQFKTAEELAAYYQKSGNVFIAGGDQLWNNYHPCGNDDAYKLTFATRGKKIAYGTSMGRDNFSEEELRALADKVQEFEDIMLREQSTVALLEKHTDVPVHHVIDPVGLLNVEEFEKLAVKPDIKEPYAVMYLADSGALLDEAVELLSKKLGLKIVHICGFRKKCYCDYFEKDSGPEEILGYIRHAEFVLSASFHATMFSILFNKQFATLLPGTQTNARINDILSFVGLSDRVITSKEELSHLETPIDYSKVNPIVEAFREDSKKALMDALTKAMEAAE